jgi:hypothetical protein
MTHPVTLQRQIGLPYVSVDDSVVLRIGWRFRCCQIDWLEERPELPSDQRFRLLTGDLCACEMVPRSPPRIAEQVVGSGGAKDK